VSAAASAPRGRRKLVSWGLVALALSTAAALGGVLLVRGSAGPVSQPGVYRGYSAPIYDGFVRTSQYVPVSDGTRLAVDIYRPTHEGKAVNEPLPVIWTHERYHRADLQNGTLTSAVLARSGLQQIIEHGYVIGIVDVRGAGASFGTFDGPFAAREAQDAYDITEWFAAQPWCNGKVGMFGRSYGGITQFMAASTKPPHLKAIFPEMALFDMYAFNFPGGVFRADFVRGWSRLVEQLDTQDPAAPVDADPAGALLRQALAQHATNKTAALLFTPMIHRDSQDAATGEKQQITRSPSTYLDQINQSQVPVYLLAGWYDIFTTDALLWFANLKNPKKLVIGPWSHGDTSGFDRSAEQLRWFDFWLKDIDNRVTEEAPIHYFTMGAPSGQGWRSARQWPLPEQVETTFWFCAQPAHSVASRNDGSLCRQVPDADGQDSMVVDYAATSGPATRWTSGYRGRFGYPDMRENDQRGLTYTTPPLQASTEVTGHPIVRAWVSTRGQDVDVIAYLEEVDASGASRYITEGILRVSHRATHQAPFENFGLPYHRSFKEDVAPPAEGPVELAFDMHPTSNVFDTGHRIRVTVVGADRDNLLTLTSTPPPTMTVYRSRDFPSRITLPIIPRSGEAPANTK